MARLLLVFSIMLSMIALIPVGCNSSEVGSPVLSTYPATEKTETSARLNGEVNKLGSLRQVTVHFLWQCYEAVPEGGDPWPIHMTEDQVMTDVGEFSAVISGLEPGTKYIFEAVASADEFTVAANWFVTAGAISTLDATGITASSATLNGNLTILRGVSRQVCFAWGTTSGSPSQGTPWQMRTSTGTFSAEISGLSAGTTYYFYARDDMGGRGEEKSFYVALADLTVQTLDSTGVSGSSATLNGHLLGLGGRSGVEVYFLWGTASGSYLNETARQAMTSAGTFSAEITGLTPGTTYYYVARAGDTAQGAEKGFYVAYPDVTVQTLDPEGVSSSSATLKGNLLGLGGRSSVEVYFRWGTAAGSYPNETPRQTMTSAGTFSANITGLIPATTCYYVARAGDTAQGVEKSFHVADTTGATVETLDPSLVTTILVTLEGNLVDMGGASSVEVYFLWGTESGVYPNETTHKTMTAPGAFSIQVTAMFTPGTDYYFVARAGTAQGSEKSFQVY